MSGHDHSHALPAAGRRGRLAVVFSITATIMVAEVIGALASGSLALLADAGHMATDTASLALAYAAFRVGRRGHDDRRKGRGTACGWLLQRLRERRNCSQQQRCACQSECAWNV